MSALQILLLSSVSIFAVLNSNAQEESAIDTSKGYAKDTLMLKEVAIKVTKPVSRLASDGIVTTVKGTALQEIGTAKDVLGYIPGVISSNGTIEVFGKGTPVIYINGREMRSPIELDQLKSEKIKDIKLITNPGARYEGHTNAVIRITTIKEVGEGFALDSRTTLGYRDYMYGKEQLDMNYRSKGLDIFCMLEYDNIRTKGSSINIQNTWTEPAYLTKLAMSTEKKTQLYEGQIGMNYTTASMHSFGFYYQMTHRPEKMVSEYASEFWSENNLMDFSYSSQYDNVKYTEHLLDGYYSGDWGDWEADFTFDLMWRNNKNNQEIQETNYTAGHKTINICDRSAGRLFAAEFNISRNLLKGILDLGTEYTDSRRSDNFINNEGVLPADNNMVKEYDISIYAELMQRFGPLSAQIGLRYEHIGSNYFDNGIRIAEQSHKYDEFLPSVTLAFPWGKTTFQISYARKYTRPLYSQLSSTINYINQYLYETGNPLLKTSFSDNAVINFKYNWLIVMANYKHVTDQIITGCMSYDSDPYITLLKKINSPNALQQLQVMISAMPGFVNKWYYPALSCGIVAQFYKTNYLGNSSRFNNPMAIIRFNNIFRLPNNYMLTANFHWRSEGNSENIKMGQSWQIDLSASKTFNQHWNLKLSVNDILNTAHKNSFTIYDGIRDVHIEKCSNTRGIELSIGYKFNTTKSKYIGTGAGESEKQRL